MERLGTKDIERAGIRLRSGPTRLGLGELDEGPTYRGEAATELRDAPTAKTADQLVGSGSLVPEYWISNDRTPISQGSRCDEKIIC